MADTTTTENEKRAERAYRCALYYQQQAGVDDIEASITDLTADLYHLADQYGMDQNELHLRALSHYEAEASSTY